MRRTIVGVFVALATSAYAQAPEQIPDRQALYERGETLDTAGRQLQRGTESVALRREGVELEHQGVIDKQRALDVDPEVYKQDDALLRRAMRSR